MQALSASIETTQRQYEAGMGTYSLPLSACILANTDLGTERYLENLTLIY